MVIWAKEHYNLGKFKKRVPLYYFVVNQKRGPTSPLFYYRKMDLRTQLMTWTETSLANPSLFLVDVVLSSRHLSKITVVVDGDQGVNIDECTRISRELSSRLDELNPDTEHYVLEVTTPGLDQPLRLNRQYRKNVGRGVKVHMKDKRIESGILVEVGEHQIVIRQEWREGKVMQEKLVTLLFTEIEKTYVVISFK